MSFTAYLHRGISFILHGIRPVDVRAEIAYLSPSNSLQDKRIIVTGGGRGLGKAMARKFVNEGAKVLITGRNTDTLRATASEIGCHWLQLDMDDFASFAPFITNAVEILGGIDCLVNNAGISLHENSFFDVTPESFSRQLHTNLEGPFFLSQEVSRQMIKEKSGGSLLFISSETGETADIRPYGLIKASVNSLVRGLAYLFVKDAIRVNAIAPGVTASDMTGIKADDNLYLPYNSAHRAYLPEEIAELAVYLVSDRAACISGQIIACNNANTVNPRCR